SSTVCCWCDEGHDPLAFYQSGLNAILTPMSVTVQAEFAANKCKPPVFPLLLAAYLPGRIKTALKDPMLAATKFWALAHLLVNGALGDVLFGLYSRRSIEREFKNEIIVVVADVVGFAACARGRSAGIFRRTTQDSADTKLDHE